MSLKLEKVLILDGVDEICSLKLTEAGIKVTTQSKLSKEDLIDNLKVHDGVIVRSATKIKEDILSGHTGRLKVIGRAGTGVDNIDVEASTRKGILVMNTPAGNSISAAEHTCAMICALSRSLPQACSSLKEGKWDRKAFMGNELYGKTLAIIGLGRIGREVAQRMQSFGMTTVGYDPIFPKESAEALGIKFLSLAEIWPIADYITVHTPLLPSTRNLVGTETFNLCKKSVKIVNVARGGIVDEEALLVALQNGSCSGAALDVFKEEPPKNLSLIQHPKVICTPHLGASTIEAQERVAEEIADQFVNMSMGRSMNGVVNAPALTLAGSAQACLWIELACSLAKLALQMSSDENKAIDVLLELYGKECCQLTDIVIPSVQMGIISEIKKENVVNLVSAALLSKELNINVKVNAHSFLSPQFQINGLNSIHLQLSRGSSVHTVVGAIAGGSPTLYNVDKHSWPLGLTLKQNLIFYRSQSSVPALGAIVLSLQTSLSDILSSSESDNENLLVVRTKEYVSNLPSNKEAELVAQISF